MIAVRRDVVALVPALNAAATVGTTVTALRDIGVDDVVVIDDGSADDTGAAARAAGARVLPLRANRGKGGAIAAGVAATPEADAYLLIDADTGGTAAAASALLDAYARNHADLVVAVLPSAGGRGGFGLVSRLAAWAIERASGRRVAAPLSGQRVVRADVLRSIRLAPRFGLETAMTIDALGAGATMEEVAAPFDHDHRGRTPAGFAHRARQGWDVACAAAPRLARSRR